MTFWCRNCSNPGYQPFRGAASLEFWAASVSNPGSVPAVRLVIGDTEASRFCNSEVGRACGAGRVGVDHTRVWAGLET